MLIVLTVLKEGLASGVLSILRIAPFFIPIMIVVEIARHYKVLELLSSKIKRVLDFLTLPLEAAFPLLVGVCFGIVYGSALIIDYAREGYLEKRDLLLIGIFLSIGHSLIEDTLIFTAFGANPLIIIFIRFTLAFLITRLAAYVMDLLASRRSLRQVEKKEEAG
ncbi:MAG: nucleoside recognition protein [Firmicutes bacterium]|nr:nucleoside recognition protein [Bacillota bacterium]